MTSFHAIHAHYSRIICVPRFPLLFVTKFPHNVRVPNARIQTHAHTYTHTYTQTHTHTTPPLFTHTHTHTHNTHMKKKILSFFSRFVQEILKGMICAMSHDISLMSHVVAGLQEVEGCGHVMVPVRPNLVDEVWDGRPHQPTHPVIILPLKYTGESGREFWSCGGFNFVFFKGCP